MLNCCESNWRKGSLGQNNLGGELQLTIMKRILHDRETSYAINQSVIWHVDQIKADLVCWLSVLTCGPGNITNHDQGLWNECGVFMDHMTNHITSGAVILYQNDVAHLYLNQSTILLHVAIGGSNVICDKPYKVILDTLKHRFVSLVVFTMHNTIY